MQDESNQPPTLSYEAASVGEAVDSRGRVLHPVTWVIAPAAGAAIGLLGWKWLVDLRATVVLFALLPFAASLVAGTREGHGVGMLASASMYLSFAARALMDEWVVARPRLADGIFIMLFVYGGAAFFGSMVGLLLNVVVVSAGRWIARRTAARGEGT